MQIQLSQDQEKALRKLYYWINNNSHEPITLGGYAGTGKTTLIAIFRKLLKRSKPKLKVAFCSYTGKGALVLKTKLDNLDATYKGDFVGTIHSLIYEPIIGMDEQIVTWAKRDFMRQDLIIVDEASMIDQRIWDDLQSYGKPILAVGDHGQLDPIEGKFNLMQKPLLKLENIHRQVADNPIVKLSLQARSTGAIRPEKYSDTVIKYDRAEPESQEALDELVESYDDETMFLCGLNKTRVYINNYIRAKKGFRFSIPVPVAGDKVVCLRNNHEKMIYNGMTGIIQTIEEVDENWYFANIKMENDINYTGKIFKHQFNSEQSINMTRDRKKLKNGDIFDFGYAVTVHKAQGSEARKVVLIEERFSRMDDEAWKRWIYTGVTRAREELYIFGN